MSDAAAPPASGPTASGPPAPIKTPCIKVCVVDGESGLCMGCYRQLSEVAGWARLSDDERAAIMAELPARRSRIRPEKLAMFG
jgi:predicted Fe-S protein YdhL (DUF1289 family)